MTNSIQLLQVKLIRYLASMITPVSSDQLHNSRNRGFYGEENDLCGVMYTGNNDNDYNNLENNTDLE